VFNWRIVLGGAASAAILTAGVAAPAFAASTPVPLNGITQGLSTSQAGGVFCGLPNLPVSLGVSAAAGAIGESCGSTPVNSSSQSIMTPPQASAPQAGRQGASQDIGRSSGQTNGPARTASAPPASGSSSAMPGLNSLSGAIPNLGNAAGAVPSLGNATGSATSGNGNGGLNSVSNTVGGVTGGLSGSQAGSQAGSPAGGPATDSLP
jgi:hypothetical protein